jgi:hypothetical protein
VKTDVETGSLFAGSDVKTAPMKRPRCAACQLQLCKSRDEPPHAALTEIGRDQLMGARHSYTCGTCGATLASSSDMSKPGWEIAR